MYQLVYRRHFHFPFHSLLKSAKTILSKTRYHESPLFYAWEKRKEKKKENFKRAGIRLTPSAAMTQLLVIIGAKRSGSWLARFCFARRAAGNSRGGWKHPGGDGGPGGKAERWRISWPKRKRDTTGDEWRKRTAGNSVWNWAFEESCEPASFALDTRWNIRVRARPIQISSGPSDFCVSVDFRLVNLGHVNRSPGDTSRFPLPCFVRLFLATILPSFSFLSFLSSSFFFLGF